MKIQEAAEKSLTVKWEIGTCKEGEMCWCRTIKPTESILFNDGDSQDEYWIVGSGELHKDTAEYFVKLHNKQLENK
jgi:hypothetical protein